MINKEAKNKTQQTISKLNKAQQEAVRQIDGPILILAGAGSGKTTTITTRLAYLLEVVGIPAANTLTLTFTNKAALEMRERALNMIEDSTYPPLLCTFHKFGLLFLKFNIHLLQRKNNFVVIDTDDKKKIIKKLNNELPTALIASEISKYKNSLLSPDQVYKQAEFHNYQVIAKVYEEYENYLIDNNLVDFDDLLVITYKILDNNEELAIKTSQKYQYIMIDEYQDTNELQLKLIQKLCLTHNNICVVGDDDQSIYGWRGAHIRNILEFDQDFKESKIIKLQENYRSKHPIIEAANSLIQHNRSRLGKKLISTRGSGDEITILYSDNENEETKKITQIIAKLIDGGTKPKNIAVLYRVNALSRALEDGLNRSNISYRLVGGLKFYDRAEIKDIISYLRLTTNIHDDFSFKRVVNKPKRGIGKATLDKLELAALQNGISIFGYIDQTDNKTLESIVKAKNTKTLKQFIDDIKEAKKASQQSTYQFIDYIEDKFHLKEIYSNLPDGQDKILNLDEFYGMFREYVKEYPQTTLDEFLNDIALQSDQDEIEGDSIYIMSIHAAKGLEFDHVFTIGLEEGFLPLLGDGNDLEEERRLGYVAFTRARDTLTLSHSQSRFYKGRRSELSKSRFLNEAGLCKGSLIIEKNQMFKKGDLVRHKIFGAGRILSISASGRETKLKINFSGNHRDILASFVEKL